MTLTGTLSSSFTPAERRTEERGRRRRRSRRKKGARLRCTPTAEGNNDDGVGSGCKITFFCPPAKWLVNVHISTSHSIDFFLITVSWLVSEANLSATCIFCQLLSGKSCSFWALGGIQSKWRRKTDFRDLTFFLPKEKEKKSDNKKKCSFEDNHI